MERKTFTSAQIEHVKANYANTSTATIAKEIDRTIRSVYGLANKLNLKKSEAFLNSEFSGRLKPGSTIGLKTTFKKGRIPHTKGKKIEEFMSPETAEKFRANMFKKGNVPHNTFTDGMESIYTDVTGRQYFKVKVPGIKNLVFKHHLLYTQHHGSIPDGYVIIFKDGNSLNCTPENLEAITKEANMLRNSINRFPEELKSVIRLLSKLTKKTQSHEKQD
jgi:hypothetical protein